jgi:hypothetical protein
MNQQPRADPVQNVLQVANPSPNRILVARAVSALSLLLATTSLAQNTTQDSRAMSGMSAEQSRQTEAAHRELLQTPVTAADRARLTARLRGKKSVPIRAAPIQHRNFVDDYIFGRMERDHVPHARLCTDEEFLRRVTLDLIGVIPDADSVRAFVADSHTDKRTRVVDELIGSSAYLDRWSYYFTALFHLGRGGLGAGVDLFHLWLRE